MSEVDIVFRANGSLQPGQKIQYRHNGSSEWTDVTPVNGLIRLKDVALTDGEPVCEYRAGAREPMPNHLLTVELPKVKLKVSGSQGEASLHEDVYRPILDALADHKPRSLGEIERIVAARGVHLARIVEAVMILASGGALHPAQPDAAIDAARPHAARLNARLCGMARYSEDVNSLASPVTGGAV